MSPYFYVVFFGIFHVIGGLALGRGLHEKFSGGKKGSSLTLWGAILGIPPTVFDWLFLINAGEVVAGWIGPILFVVSIVIGVFFLRGEITKKNEKSFAAILMGGTALTLGSMLIPYLLEQSKTQDDLGIVDYLCGGSIPIFFILIGGSFAYNGFSAIFKRRTFDEHIEEREIKIEEKNNARRK